MGKFDEMFWSFPQLLCRENDDDDAGDDGDDGAAAAAAAEAAAAEAAAKKGKEAKLFTQDDVDKIVVKRNKALDEKYKTLEASLQKASKDKSITQEERDRLADELENLKNSQLSEKERAAKEKEKAERKYQEELAGTVKQRDEFKALFENSLSKRALLDAAIKHDAYNPQQIVELLTHKTKVVELRDDDGTVVLDYAPKVDWTETTSDGQTIRLQKTPEEVVESMKEDDQYANLFRSNIAKGVGAGSGTPTDKSGKVNPAKISTEEYMRLRKTPEGRKALGITR